MVGRTLAADADVLAAFAAGLDGHGEERLDGRIAFVEGRGDEAGVSVETEGELRHVVRADGEAVEVLEELVGEDGVGRDFAHHVEAKAVDAALEAVLFHDFVDALGFIERTHERNHQFDVGEAHFVAHELHGAAFHREAFGELVRDVAGGAAEAEHRIFFIRLVEGAADELAVLVRLEVGHADDDLLRVEGGGNRGHAFGDALLEEFLRAGIAGGEAFGGVAQFARDVRVLKNNLRVDADVVVDDELKAGKADALVRDGLELEGELRVADVHHDLDRDFREGAALDFLNGHFLDAFVDVARVAFGAGHRHFVVFAEAFRGVAAADDGRDAEFAGDDGRVAGTTAAVRHDGGGLLHHRFPVGVGHVRDENVAGLNAIHFSGAVDDADRARADLLADGAALTEQAALGLERVAELHVGLVLLGLHRFRTGLKDVDLAVVAVLAPLDVHRTTVVLFNDAGEAGQFDHVFVGDGELAAVFGRDIDRADRAADGLVGFELHLDELGAERLADDRILAGIKDGLVDVELVGVHGALDHGFAEAVGGGDEDHLVEAGFGVEREHHAGGAAVGAAHALHAGGQGDFSVREALVDAVGDGAVVVEGGEDLLHVLEDGVDADDVEHRFLLTGEGGVGKVFSRGGRANGNGDFLLTVLEPFVEFADFLFELGRERSGFNPAADLGAGSGERLDVVDVKGGETLGNALLETAFLQEEAEGFGRGGETVRHADAGARELAEQFAERSVLAADAINVGHAKLTKGENVTTLYHAYPLKPQEPGRWFNCGGFYPFRALYAPENGPTLHIF